jgi:hypothetical protein
VAESNTKESSPVAQDSDTNTITETSDIISIEIQDIEGIGPKTQIWSAFYIRVLF